MTQPSGAALPAPASRTRVTRGLAALVALCAGLAAPSRAYPQGDAQADARAIESYRLTMPVLRKVLPALYHPDAGACEKGKNENRDPSRMPLAEMTARLEECAPVRNAVRRSGLSTREAALTLAALVRASKRSAEEESAKAAGGQAPATGPGPLKDNVRLIRDNEAELGRLARPSGQAGGRS